MKGSPIIVLIDMDCFYVQVELKSSPEFLGKPSAVVQYNSWRGGSIIAVSYEARSKGVNRSVRGDEAKLICPDVHLFQVPECRGKADLTKYRTAGAAVIKCLSKHANRIERASIDEAYIDLTDEVDNLLVAAPNSPEAQLFWQKDQHFGNGCHIVGFSSYDDWLEHVWQLREIEEHSDDIRLALGAFLVQKMREDVYKTLGFRCSAGVAHSKVLAKYACGVHKPNQQTIVPPNYVLDILQNAPIDKIRNLGGKMGSYVQEQLNVTTMGGLAKFSLDELTEKFGERTGPWLFYLCRGQDDESVLSRQLAQSIGCSKNFPGKKQLNTHDLVFHWLTQMAEEISERLNEDRQMNARMPTHMCVSYRQFRPEISEGSRHSFSASRVVPIGDLTMASIRSSAMAVLLNVNSAAYRSLPEGSWYPPLVSLGLSAGKFRAKLAKNDISRFLIDVPTEKFNSRKQTEKSSSKSKVTSEADMQIEPSQMATRDIVSVSVPSKATSTADIPTRKRGYFVRRLQQQLVMRHEDGQMDNDSVVIQTTNRRLQQQLVMRHEDVQMDNDSEVIQATNMSMEHSQDNRTSIHDSRTAVPISVVKDNEDKCRNNVTSTTPVDISSGESPDSSCLDMSDSPVPSPPPDTTSDLFTCDQCSRKISMWEAPEHVDWHVATNLQKQLTKEIYEEDARNRAANVKKHIKIKRKATGGVKNPVQVKQHTLDRFFTK